MIAIDTNVIVRLIALDDAKQLASAEQLVQSGPIFVPLLAIVEAEWVLRSRHRFDRARICYAFKSLFLAETVQVELESFAHWALDRFAEGADLADMLLLVAARDCESFATFDSGVSRAAGPNSPIRVETLT